VYYNQAMPNFNNGSYFVAISIFGQALAVYQGVENTASNLSSTFTGMPDSYLRAAQNLVYAAEDDIKATNVMINNCSQSTNVDAGVYSSQGDTYYASVRQFLTSTTP
jgi:hypothetical protein